MLAEKTHIAFVIHCTVDTDTHGPAQTDEEHRII